MTGGWKKAEPETKEQETPEEEMTALTTKLKKRPNIENTPGTHRTRKRPKMQPKLAWRHNPNDQTPGTPGAAGRGANNTGDGAQVQVPHAQAPDVLQDAEGLGVEQVTGAQGRGDAGGDQVLTEEGQTDEEPPGAQVLAEVPDVGDTVGAQVHIGTQPREQHHVVPGAEAPPCAEPGESCNLEVTQMKDDIPEVTHMKEDKKSEEEDNTHEENPSGTISGSSKTSMSEKQIMKNQDRRKDFNGIKSRGKMLSNSMLRGGGHLRLNHPVQIGLKSAVSVTMVIRQIFGNTSLTPKLYIKT